MASKENIFADAHRSMFYNLVKRQQTFDFLDSWEGAETLHLITFGKQVCKAVEVAGKLRSAIITASPWRICPDHREARESSLINIEKHWYSPAYSACSEICFKAG